MHKKLTDLKNIGSKIAGRLNEVGIFSEEELSFYSAIEAHKMIKKNHSNETLPICYYLYSFEGALCNKHWNRFAEWHGLNWVEIERYFLLSLVLKQSTVQVRKLSN